MTSSEFTQCEAYLKQGAVLDVAVFMSWFNARKECEWLKEKDDDYGETPMHTALLYNAPEAVAMALFEAWPDAVKVKNNRGNTPLHRALMYNAPEAVAMALLRGEMQPRRRAIWATHHCTLRALKHW